MAKGNIVNVKFLADTSGMQKGINQVNGQLSGFSKSLKTFGIAFAGAFSVRALANFATESIKYASDLEESLSKVGVVFKQNAGEIEDWSKDSVQALGLPQAEALEAVGTFGNLFTSMGVGIDTATDLSQSTVQLASDLASFNNIDLSQAQNALRSGLSGETEPLKRLGIVINQAAIEAKALELGLVGVGEEIDSAAKAQATYALIMEKSANAQGDFERTSDGLANQLRILDAQATETKGAFGVGFLNAMQGADGGIQDVTRSLEALEVIMKSTGDTVGNFASDVSKALGPLADFIEEINKDWDDQGLAIRSVRFAWNLATTDLIELTEQVRTNDFSWAQNNEVTLTATEQARENAFAQRALAGELDDTTGAIDQQANAWRDLVEASPGSAQVAKQSRDMDSFSRSLDKNSVYWKNAGESAKDYFQQLDRGTGSGGRSGGSTARVEQEFIKIKKLFKDLSSDGDIAIQAVGNTAKKIPVEVANGIQAAFTVTQEAINEQLRIIEEGQAEITRISSDIVSTILGGVGIATKNAEGEPLSAEEMANSLFGSIADQQNVAETVARTIGTALPPALLNQIISLDSKTAVELANYLGANPEMLTQLTANYDKLSTDTKTLLGQPMGEAWATIGGQSASKMISSAEQKIKDESEDFKRFVRKQLKTTVTVDVRYNYINPPGSAGSPPGSGRSAVREIQNYERLNGRSWRS
jgi:hypothetical protein